MRVLAAINGITNAPWVLEKEMLMAISTRLKV